MDIAVISVASLVLLMQSGLLAYCIKIEHRLTRLETIVSQRLDRRAVPG